MVNAKMMEKVPEMPIFQACPTHQIKTDHLLGVMHYLPVCRKEEIGVVILVCVCQEVNIHAEGRDTYGVPDTTNASPDS